MMIRRFEVRDRFATKALWQEIFHDTEPFANFFFSRRFTPDLSYGAFEEGRLVSMALGRYVRMQNPSLNAVMISGVSTLPEFRHQGLMTEVMQMLVMNAQRRACDIALLSPVVPDLYAQFGFHPLTFALKVTETASEHQEIIETHDAEMLYPVYMKACAEHSCMLFRSRAGMRLALEEYDRDEGIVLITPDRQGYLCYLPQDNGIEITECLADTPQAYRALLEAAAFRSPSRTASALLPTDCAMSGTLCRPLHALALRKDIDLREEMNSRRSFCVETY